MLQISRILGELVMEYIQFSEQSDRNYRLIIPGLTEKIAQETQEYLHLRGTTAYLIVGEDNQPNKEKGWMRPVGLTSKRIDSFIAVVEPGQLAHIQDSIRGAGGAIRSLAFSEEWPWIDNGSEAFRFDGPFLDKLLDEWTNQQESRQWLRSFILKALVKGTKTCSFRTQLLLEDVLGTFSPSNYPSLEDIRTKFLFHIGVPFPSMGIPNVTSLIKNSTHLCQSIVDRCQKDDDVREYTLNTMVPEVFTDESEQNKVRESLIIFLDGLGISRTQNLGLLAFHSCWGDKTDDTIHWQTLHAEVLKELFDIKDITKAELSCEVKCDRGIISDNGKSIATFIGEKLSLTVGYNIPQEQFNSNDDWKIAVTSRKRELIVEPIQLACGTFELTLDTIKFDDRYSSRIPLRLLLTNKNNIQTYDIRIALHLCGEQRSSFVVLEPSFDVYDATPIDDDEIIDKKIEISDPVHLYLFHAWDLQPELHDENDNQVSIGTAKTGIWRTTERIDPTLEASGQSIRVCKFKDREAILCLEARDVEKGEFTIEDELRVQLAGFRDGHIKELLKLFAGENREPYPHLGKLNDASRRRIYLTSQVTNSLGWKPLLTNLLKPNHDMSGQIGQYINYLGIVDADGFNGLSLPEDATKLLKNYIEARDVVCKKVEEGLIKQHSQIQHPVYASHPVYVSNNAKEIEGYLITYLKSYIDILNYLKITHRDLEYPQLFVLSHLDCVVHWDNNNLRNAIFLVGPWHPMVLAKRFMVQASLVERGQRLVSSKEGKNFRNLTVLLERIQGFRWLPGLSAQDRIFELIYVSATSDPGWHLGFKANIEELAIREGMDNLINITNIIKRNYGIDSNIVPAGTDSLASSCLASYMRAYPSRRTAGIRVCRGYFAPKIVKSIDSYLHSENGPTINGEQLPGGVRLYFEETVNEVEDINWFDPPIYMYEYADDSLCFAEENPDIYMLEPEQSLSFHSYSEEKYHLPRANGWESVFFESLNYLTEGQSLIPKSITYELQMEPDTLNLCNIGDLFIAVTSTICSLERNPLTITRSIKLPERLDCPWAVSPGEGLDPAVLVQYVRHGMSRSIQERALWDYKVDLARQSNSYYVLSTIPRSFQVSVNGVFGRDDVANGFIGELGMVGIAIGGEALKSGRHALGVVGLVGTVRLFLGLGGNGDSALKCSENHVGFLIPVDSFASFFGHLNPQNGQYSKRTDLLAIQLILPEKSDKKMRIYACGVESKYVSDIYNDTSSHQALNQARSTFLDFKLLVNNSLENGSMPERLALISLLRFGLRISSPSSPREIRKWTEIERRIYKAVLQKQYEFVIPRHEAVLVSTEMGLVGSADLETLPDGLWIRLNKTHWPGVSETPKITEIRQKLSELFYTDTPDSDEGDLIVEQDSVLGNEDPKEDTDESPNHFSGGIETTNPIQSNGFTETNLEDSDERPTNMNGPLQKIIIGVDSARRAVYYDPQSQVVPLDNLNMMITGSSGTGKTQFLKYMICQLRLQGKNVLILDFKNDFASDTFFANQAQLSRVIVNFDGLPYNPLIPYPIQHPITEELFLQCGQHISGVANILKQTYGLGAQQQASLKRAIVNAFTLLDIPTTESVKYNQDMQFPDFSNVGSSLEADNISAFNRLDPLFTLGLFREDYRDVSFHSLVNRSVILDLSQIPSNELKNALAQLVVMSAHAYYNSQPHSGIIRQMLVFDEAHRVLKSDFLLKLVRECRAYGIGTILSSQYPSEFPPDISASMATKIIHDNGRDIDKIRDIVRLLGCEGREAEVSSLDKFQAFVGNRHYPNTVIRTMNYPIFLIWSYLQEKTLATKEELSKIGGLDLSQLPIVHLIRQLERNGLVEERDGHVYLLG